MKVKLVDLISTSIYIDRESVINEIKSIIKSMVESLEIKIIKGKATDKDVNKLKVKLQVYMSQFLDDFYIHSLKEEKLLNRIEDEKRVDKDYDPTIKLSKEDREKLVRVKRETFKYINIVMAKYRKVIRLKNPVVKNGKLII